MYYYYYYYYYYYVLLLLLLCPLQVAVPDLAAACKDADILVFVLPHQFVPKTCQAMLPNIKKGAIAISLIKVSGAVHLFAYCS